MFCPPEEPRDENQYRQCSLRRGNTRTVSHLPIEFAVVGKMLSLKENDGSWSPCWVVTDVYGKSSGNAILRDEMFRRRMNKNSSLARK